MFFILRESILRSHGAGFQCGNGRQGLESGSRGIQALNGPVEQRLLRVFGHGRPVIIRQIAPGEGIRIISREGNHGLYGAGLGIHHQHGAGIIVRIHNVVDDLLRPLLQIDVYGQVQILAVFGRDVIKNLLGASSGPLDVGKAALFAPKDILIMLFQTRIAQPAVTIVKRIVEPFFVLFPGFIVIFIQILLLNDPGIAQ